MNSSLKRKLMWSIIISLVYTLVVINYSTIYGRLSVPQAYDDASYLYASTLYFMETKGSIADALSMNAFKAHSLWHSRLGTWSYLVFGLNKWAPYASNSVFVWVLMLGILFIMRRSKEYLYYLITVVCCSLTFVFMTVHEYRPDLPAALLTALGGVSLLLLYRERRITLIHQLPSLLLFGSAMYVKPMMTPYIIVLLSITQCLGILLLIIDEQKYKLRYYKKEILNACLFVLISIIIISPWMIVNWKHFSGYLSLFRTVEENRAWAWQGSLLTKLTYLFTVWSNASFYSVYGVLIIGLLIVAIVKRQIQVLTLHITILLFVVASYCGIMLNRNLTAFFGSTFYYTSLFHCIWCCSAFFALNLSRKMIVLSRFCLGLSFLLLLVQTTPDVITKPSCNDSSARNANKLQKIVVGYLSENLNADVYLGFIGDKCVTRDNVLYELMLQSGDTRKRCENIFNFGFDSDGRVGELPALDLADIKINDYVITTTPLDSSSEFIDLNPGLEANRQAVSVHQQILMHSDYSLLDVFTIYYRKYYLFKRKSKGAVSTKLFMPIFNSLAKKDSYWSMEGSDLEGYIGFEEESNEKQIHLKNKSGKELRLCGKKIIINSESRTFRFSAMLKGQIKVDKAIYGLTFKLTFSDGTFIYYTNNLIGKMESNKWTKYSQVDTFEKKIVEIAPYCILYHGEGDAYFRNIKVEVLNAHAE